jgi:NCS1 family nucleobase:cation symporter-1
MGVLVTSAAHAILTGVPASTLWDPVVILSHITSASPPPGSTEPLIASGGMRFLVAVLALFGVGVATVSVNIAANVVSPANDFANLSPKHISFKTGGLITGIPGILIMPWKLLSSAEMYIFNWLIGYSALLGPIAGIMIADYWIVRHKELDVPYAGTNMLAVIALIAGVLPNLPGFLKSAGIVGSVPSFFEAIYVYAWFTGFIISGLIYVVGMMMRAPAGSPASSAAR